MLEVDANANPLREGLLQDIFAMADGAVSLPAGPGLGLEPDIKKLASLRSLHLERRA
jgi:D-galactarolactone cycloisomerase